MGVGPMSVHGLADIRAHVGMAMDVLKGIKVRGAVVSVSEDPEDSTRVVIEIKVPAKGKKSEVGAPVPSSFSYSIPRRLVEGLTIGDPVIVTLTRP